MFQAEPGMAGLVTDESYPATREGETVPVHIAGATQLALNGVQECRRGAVSDIHRRKRGQYIEARRFASVVAAVQPDTTRQLAQAIKIVCAVVEIWKFGDVQN